MNRVRMLLGLLALFFSLSNPCPVLADDCYMLIWSKKAVNEHHYSTWTTDASNPHSYSLVGSWYNAQGSPGWFVYGTVYHVTEPGVGTIAGYMVHQIVQNLGPINQSSVLIPWSDTNNSMPLSAVSQYLSCSTCDTADNDGDGVCNSCDIKPNEPDQKHCIWQQLVVAGAGQVAIMAIDQSGNCDGSSTVEYRNPTVNDQVVAGTVPAYWTGNHAPIDAPTCQGDDGTGNCGCGYTTSANSSFNNMEPSDSPQISDGLKEQLQKADQAANDDKYDDCSNIKARCEAACLTRGGVVKNSCSVSDGTTYAKCECKSEFAYDTATPTETSTDTSTNGDVAETGGTDTNADGKADVYAAVKDAIHDSGLTSKLDSANTQLNNIGNKIDTVGSAINGVGSAVNGLGEGINGIGQGINGLGTKLDTIAGKLDNLNNNANQDITATGSADLPGHNSYDSSIGTIEEISLADTIGSFISNGLPIVSYFKGSYINIGSASPALSTQVFGKTITIDFSGMESILNSMGLVLVSVSTILSFMIIIRG